MSESNQQHPFSGDRGFSFVELMVALVFTSFLMAGMYKVFTASLSNLATMSETLGAQRNSRWALVQLQDDLLQAGFLLPPRVLNDSSLFPGGSQPPLKIETPVVGPSGAKFSYIDSDGVTAIELPTNPDLLEVVMDYPLGVAGSLSSPGPTLDATGFTVKIPSGGDQLRPDDIVFIADSAREFFTIASVSGGGDTYTLTLKTSGALLDKYGNEINSVVSSAVSRTHFAGAPVEFIRPLQVVRYSVLALNLDPANAAATVPCLVRQQKNLADAGFTTTPGDPRFQILVEGVSGFALDWSLDGGRSWIRKDNGLGSSQWANIQTKTSGAFDTIAASNPFTAQLVGGMNSSSDPFWFRYVPVALKIDVETRTKLKRTEYAATTGTADYNTRRHTLIVSPRNFTLGAP